MNSTVLTRIIALGALSGMRSMAGPAALAFRQGGVVKAIASTLAAGEMAVDKTSLVGDRIDTVPLAGRAAMGALAGGLIARESHGNMLLGGILGAVAAVGMAHLAFRLRKKLPAGPLGGVIEDAVVIGLGSMHARR